METTLKMTNFGSFFLQYLPTSLKNTAVFFCSCSMENYYVQYNFFKLSHCFYLIVNCTKPKLTWTTHRTFSIDSVSYGHVRAKQQLLWTASGMHRTCLVRRAFAVDTAAVDTVRWQKITRCLSCAPIFWRGQTAGYYTNTHLTHSSSWMISTKKLFKWSLLMKSS